MLFYAKETKKCKQNTKKYRYLFALLLFKTPVTEKDVKSPISQIKEE